MEPLKKIDISLESRIVANIVSDTKLLDQCYSIIDPTLFESSLSQIVVEWSLDYYKNLHEAPGANLKDVFATRSKELNDSDAQLVYSYMRKGDWAPTGNVEFAKKQLEDFIRDRSIQRLVDKLKAKADSGHYKDCVNIIAEWKRPEVNDLKVYDFFRDTAHASKSLNREEDASLLRFNGDLGDTVGDFLISDYVLWLGPAKRGKTWWLMYTALQAALQGNKVLYISLEMDEYETEDRLLQMLSGRSLKGEMATVTQFRVCGNNQDGSELFEKYEVKGNTRMIEREKDSIKKTLGNALKYSGGGEFKYFVKPTNSYTVEDLSKDLNKLEVFYNFVPTMVVIDYVDIMKFNYGNEKRFGLDKLHLQLRGLNMDRKFCLVSASQCGRGTVTGENDVAEDSIAEAVSKLNHATKIILINQSPDEKKVGIYRINVNMARHGGVSYETCVCSSCLAIGRPVVDCHRLSSIFNPEKEKDGAKELNRGGFSRKRGKYDE